MPKLFVALELPAAATADLTLIQPPRVAGVRLAGSGQMHLTLHYLGKADVERMAAALDEVAFPAFPLAVEGVGQFRTADGTVSLWAGVQETAELLEFHGTLASALAAEGFRPEARRYTPHVTLARCEPEVAAEVVEDFLARNWRFALAPILVEGFGLYSSVFVGDTPVYHRERVFPLRAAASGGPGEQSVAEETTDLTSE